MGSVMQWFSSCIDYPTFQCYHVMGLSSARIFIQSMDVEQKRRCRLQCPLPGLNGGPHHGTGSYEWRALPLS